MHEECTEDLPEGRARRAMIVNRELKVGEVCATLVAQGRGTNYTA